MNPDLVHDAGATSDAPSGAQRTGVASVAWPLDEARRGWPVGDGWVAAARDGAGEMPRVDVVRGPSTAAATWESLAEADSKEPCLVVALEPEPNVVCRSAALSPDARRVRAPASAAPLPAGGAVVQGGRIVGLVGPPAGRANERWLVRARLIADAIAEADGEAKAAWRASAAVRAVGLAASAALSPHRWRRELARIEPLLAPGFSFATAGSGERTVMHIVLAVGVLLGATALALGGAAIISAAVLAHGVVDRVLFVRHVVLALVSAVMGGAALAVAGSVEAAAAAIVSGGIAGTAGAALGFLLWRDLTAGGLAGGAAAEALGAAAAATIHNRAAAPPSRARWPRGAIGAAEGAALVIGLTLFAAFVLHGDWFVRTVWSLPPGHSLEHVIKNMTPLQKAAAAVLVPYAEIPLAIGYFLRRRRPPTDADLKPLAKIFLAGSVATTVSVGALFASVVLDTRDIAYGAAIGVLVAIIFADLFTATLATAAYRSDERTGAWWALAWTVLAPGCVVFAFQNVQNQARLIVGGAFAAAALVLCMRFGLARLARRGAAAAG